MNIEVAARLAALRKKHNLSQEQLAEALGITRQAVSKWERAESSPDMDNMMALSNLYGVTLDQLVRMSPEGEEDELFALSQEEEAEAVDEADEPEKEMWAWQKNGSTNWKLFPYPLLVTAVYLIIGAFFDLWHPGWLLFLTIPMYYTAAYGDGFDLNRIPFPLPVATIYLSLGFLFDAWHPGWIIFFAIPLYYVFAGKYLREKANFVLILASLALMSFLLGVSLFPIGYGLWVSIGALALVAVGAMETLKHWRASR